ncbi:hypothetical protein MNBD_BACTEROID03-1287 [hydrothermal vent metagenome]|uniref:DUF4249 domain-containing protein n=1 Tax=hydrothermal vent metagenome TaxID=652676 RepID=A0A3B0TIX4_9ZZZZ
MKKYFIVLFVVNIGCYKEVQVDIPKQQTVPVVSSLFQPDSVIALTLSTTQPIFEDNDTEITDALVRLYQSDDIVDTLHFKNGSFISDLRPANGEAYKLKIDIPGFKTLLASDKMPEAPNLISASFKDSVYTDSEGEFMSQATITISDIPNRTNYYELRLKQIYRDSATVGFATEIYDSAAMPVIYDFESNDIVIQNEGQLGFWSFTNPVFSDKLFNGKVYTMKINYKSLWLLSGSNNSDLIIILRSVSKDYYTYKKSLTAHIESQWSDVWDGVVEPSAMFTNIENGYGIFAGYSQVTDTIYKENQ